MIVFQNALLTVVWLFTIIMCVDLWTSPAIDSQLQLAERLGGMAFCINCNNCPSHYKTDFKVKDKK